MWDRCPPRQRGRAWQGTAQGGDSGRGPRGGVGEHPVVPMAKVAHGRSWWGTRWQIQDAAEPGEGCKSPKHPVIPPELWGKTGPSRTPGTHSGPLAANLPDPTCPHTRGAGTCSPPAPLVAGGQITPPGTPRAPSLVKEQPLPRWHRARGRGWRRGQGQQFQEGWRGCSKRGGPQLPPAWL